MNKMHPDTPKGMTGWTGSDCSIAICVQGTYAPDCLDVAPGGEGCFRCLNGGNCTAPDICTCPPEWTGHDCGTPVCTTKAEERTVQELDTVDLVKIQAFELDPCGTYEYVQWDGLFVGRGNCTAPDTCTCLCMERAYTDEDGEYYDLPWEDPLNRELPVGSVFGSRDCLSGFEGNENRDGKFTTCHLKIYVPTGGQRYSVTIIVLSVIFGAFSFVGYLWMRRRLRQRYLLAKAERRRSRKSSESNPTRRKGGAFTG